MTRNIYFSETNDSSLVIHKLDNGLFRIQLDKNFVDLTESDLNNLTMDIYDAKKTEIRK